MDKIGFLIDARRWKKTQFSGFIMNMWKGEDGCRWKKGDLMCNCEFLQLLPIKQNKEHD